MISLVDGYLGRIMLDCQAHLTGAVADYIPELAAVDPGGFGLSMCVHDGHVYSHGDSAAAFTIQSISKPLTYALALGRRGFATIDAAIGVEPSGEAFNEISVDQRRRPKNPMINAGAILAASMLLPQEPTVSSDTVDAAFADVVEFYSACAGRRLGLDERVYASESATGARNRAIAYMLVSFGALQTDPDAAIDLYFRQCSLQVTTDDLAVIGCTIANGGVNPRTGRRVLDQAVAQRVLSVMTTCGMYDGAGDWVTRVGLPAKSGVGGGILAILPGQLGIGVYSPLLDEHGNSVRGVDTCRHLSTDLGLHMFNVARESRTTIRAVYDLGDIEVSPEWVDRERVFLKTCRDRVRVYELQGDLTFAGAESAVRRLEADVDRFDVAILEISRVDIVDPVARNMVLGFKHVLDEGGRRSLVVDPDGVVRASIDRYRDDGPATDMGIPYGVGRLDPALPHVHSSMSEAVLDAEEFLVKSRLIEPGPA
ncbi:glutaminase A [Gordonia soli]|uniref:Glutaminase n=1 Tax=Gordonia soli NBRC 108243 TaxID=1223545 RepID=M0QKI1_9ACTN|nr:glutaminase A [Gordonia soli]GAC69150.1 glutaminase [Gordonia soli NBRC 108243]